MGVRCPRELEPDSRLLEHRAVGERPEQTEQTELTEEQDLTTVPVSAHHLEAVRRLGLKEGPVFKSQLRKRYSQASERPGTHP